MPDPKPNILFLTTDQQRFDCLGVNSDGFVQTPNLDRLAGEGANLLRFYVNNPVCMPSRASLLTGKYPRNHGVTCNGIPLAESIPNIAHALGEAGYVTGNLGKLHFLPHSGRNYDVPHPDYGFHVMVNADEPGCYPDAYIQWIRKVAPEMEAKVRVPNPVTEGRNMFDHWVFDAPEELSYSAWVADETIKFIESNPDRPWFAIAGLYLPHTPCNPSQQWFDLYKDADIPAPLLREGELDDKPAVFREMAALYAEGDKAKWEDFRRYYYASCSMIDHHCGRVIEHLRASGQLDNTLVVFYSDHGEMAGDHRLMGKHQTNYESVIHVPAIVRHPATVPAGSQVEAVIEAVDLMPTVLDAVGADIPRSVDGESRWAAVINSDDAGSDAILLEFATPEGESTKTLRTATHKYWVNEQGEEALFDLLDDPDEFVNRAGDPAALGDLQEMRGRLLQKLINTEDRTRTRTGPY